MKPERVFVTGTLSDAFFTRRGDLLFADCIKLVPAVIADTVIDNFLCRIPRSASALNKEMGAPNHLPMEYWEDTWRWDR